MQVAIPAAGDGTRLRPLTADRPKGLVEVAGKPLLTHVFETILGTDEPTDEQIDELVVIVGYRGDAIRDYYGTAFNDVSLTYVDQPDRRGLADALLQAAPILEPPFGWVHGDNVCRANCGDVFARHRERDAAVTCLAERVSRDRAKEAGAFVREDGEVVGLVEKPDEPPSRLIPRGWYVFEAPILDACRLVTPGHTGEYELSDAVDLLLYAGYALETVDLAGWCRNVNTPADIDAVENWL